MKQRKTAVHAAPAPYGNDAAGDGGRERSWTAIQVKGTMAAYFRRMPMMVRSSYCSSSLTWV
jgi:hypothetical protein